MEYGIQMALSFQRGEQKGFEYFFHKLFDKLVGFGYRFLSDKAAASDIVEHAFMKIWEKRETFENDLVITDYLYVIVKNECLRIIDKQKTINKYSNGYNAYEINRLSDCQADQALIKSETKEIIYNWLKQLPPECSKIMKLMYIDGLSSREIANHLELRISTVKNQKYRGLNYIKSINAGEYKKRKTIPPPQLANLVFMEVPKEPIKESKPAFIPWKNRKLGGPRETWDWKPSKRNEMIFEMYLAGNTKENLAELFNLKPDSVGNIIREEKKSQKAKKLFQSGKRVIDVARITHMNVREAIERINYLFKTNLDENDNKAHYATYQTVQQNNQVVQGEERARDTECPKEKYG